jgi:hypothetical protein
VNWQQVAVDWSSFVSGIQFDQIAYAGIVTFIIFSILTGRLYSRKAVDEIRQERDDWKQAAQDEKKANQMLLKQNGDLIDAGRTTERVIRSLPDVGGDPK